MSLLGSLLLAWAAVHAFAGVSSGFLAMRRPRPGEYLTFAILSAGLTACSIGAALVQDARSFHEAAHGQAIQAVGHQIAFAAFLRLAYELMARTDDRVLRVGIGWASGSVALILAGFFFDPGVPSRAAPPIDPSFAPPYEVALSSVGVLSAVGSGLLGTAACWDLFRARSSFSDVRLFVGGGVVGLLSFVHDTLVRVLRSDSIYLLEHFAVLGSVFMSYLLLRRYVEASDELSARTLELHDRYGELKDIQERLARHERLAAIGELSAFIAHEVRNPLAILKTAVDGLRRPSSGDSEQSTLLAVLDEETDRLNRLVRDLLAYSRPVEIQSAPVPLEPVVRRAMDFACRANPRSGEIRFDVEVDGVRASIQGDADLLERAILNVVENAIHAMPAGGTLTIRAQPSRIDDREAVALSFADTGTGMDTAVRSRAREAFFTTRPTGTGLGLAIVERVASAHGGRVELGDNPAGGTTVTLVLRAE